MNTLQENVGNLTALWRLVGERAQAYREGKSYDVVAVNDSDWPNRLWFHQEVNRSEVEQVKKDLLASAINLTIPSWDFFQPHILKLFEELGFEQRSEQYGMSLPLTEEFPTKGNLKLETVSDLDSASLWSDLFHRSFGYFINPALIAVSWREVDYFIAYAGRQPVGTSLLYSHRPEVIGIHSMGIVPEFRRQGFAEEMMRVLLNLALRMGSQYATLQASALGKGLYLKLGFTQQFVLKNYALPRRA